MPPSLPQPFGNQRMTVESVGRDGKPIVDVGCGRGDGD
jgi:hypothetical protein